VLFVVVADATTGVLEERLNVGAHLSGVGRIVTSRMMGGLVVACAGQCSDWGGTRGEMVF